MIGFLELFVHILVSPLRTQARMEGEIVLLWHQLNVLRQRLRRCFRRTYVARIGWMTGV
jgi:hypothetical protein